MLSDLKRLTGDPQRSKRVLALVIWITISLSLVLHPITSLAEDEMVMIGNPSLDLKSLSLRNARNIFSLRAKNWPNGEKISLFVYSDQNDLHKQFLVSKLGIHPSQLRTAWDRLYYSGMSELPFVVSDEAEMINKTANTSGALGYISKNHLKAHQSDVKHIQLK